MPVFPPWQHAQHHEFGARDADREGRHANQSQGIPPIHHARYQLKWCTPLRPPSREPSRRQLAGPSRQDCFGRLELALGLGEGFLDGRRILRSKQRLDRRRAREHVPQLRQPGKMQLLILESEHEEEMRQPPVERVETRAL